MGTWWVPTTSWCSYCWCLCTGRYCDGYVFSENKIVCYSSWCFREKFLLQSSNIGARRSQAQYGAVDLLLLRSEAQARKRVVYFLTVFTITGLGSMCFLLSIDINTTVMHGCFYLFTDFLLGYMFAVFESVRIHRGDWFIRTAAERDHLDAFPMVLYTIQVSKHCHYTESDSIMHEHYWYCPMHAYYVHTPHMHIHAYVHWFTQL